MRGGRPKLPVLAEISGPAPGDARAWSLRRADFEAMEKLVGGLGEHRVVVATGGERLAGAVALAGAASAVGRRTVLLECDLSRPRLAAELGLQPAPGLHEYLRRQASAAQILQPLALAGPASARASAPLVCIGAGAPAPDPALLLASEGFRHATAKLRSAYDLVVLCGPPLGPDRRALEAVAGTADALLASVPSAQLAGRGGRELRASLRRLPVAIPGAVVVSAAGA